MKFDVLLGSFCVLASVACSNTHASGVPETTVSGSAALSTYKSLPTAAVATDETGRSTRSPIDALGAFSMSLAHGHTYRFGISTANGVAVPVVFPRRTGRLDATVAVKSGNARVRLGAVRYFAAAPAGGFNVSSGSVGVTKVQATVPTSGDCSDCVNDEETVQCDDGSSATSSEDTTESGDQVNANEEMAVPEQNSPDSVEGCGGADEPDGDQNNTGT